MVVKLEKTCPHCGSHLIVRDGQYGEFHACPRFPRCKYTESIEGDTYYGIYKPPSPYCEKCNHTGFLPFIKNDKVIPHARIYCECHKDEEHYQPVRPEDFDYPMSYSFYRSLCQYQGWPEPGSCELLPRALEDDKEISEPAWEAKQWDVVQQLQGQVRFLSSKVNEMRATKKSKDIYTIQ